MNEAEKYLERFEFDIFNRSPIYEKVDLIKFAQAYADEQLKKKMPSDIDCLTQYDKLHNDSQQYAGWSNAIKWLKQQILKP